MWKVHHISKTTPWRSFERIGRYLKKAEYKGLVFTPDGSNRLDFYAVVDFDVSWCREDADQVVSVLSRTGYMIKFANCPIVWVSKMKT